MKLVKKQIEPGAGPHFAQAQRQAEPFGNFGKPQKQHGGAACLIGLRGAAQKTAGGFFFAGK